MFIHSTPRKIALILLAVAALILTGILKFMGLTINCGKVLGIPGNWICIALIGIAFYLTYKTNG